MKARRIALVLCALVLMIPLLVATREGRYGPTGLWRDLQDILTIDPNGTARFSGVIATDGNDITPVDVTPFNADWLESAEDGAAVLTAVGGQASIDGTAIGKTFAVYGSGTNYTLTATPAALNFGTTDPTITLTVAGTYVIQFNAQYAYAAATFAANQTMTTSLYRTNNTPAIVTNGTDTEVVPVIASAVTGTWGNAGKTVIYTTANTDDALTIYGSIGALPGAGTMEAVSTNTWIVAWRIY